MFHFSQRDWEEAQNIKFEPVVFIPSGAATPGSFANGFAISLQMPRPYLRRLTAGCTVPVEPRRAV